MKIILVILFVIFQSQAFSKTSPIEQILGVNNDTVMSCSAMSDEFCKGLYAAPQRGNLEFPNGDKILMGYLTKNELVRQKTVIDDNALFDNRCKLNELFKEKLNINCSTESNEDSILHEYQRLFAETANINIKLSETKLRGLYRKFERLEKKYSNALSDTLFELKLKVVPELDYVDWKDLPLEAKRKLNITHYEFVDSIMEAKYKQHPNWKNVERIFKLASNQIYSFISELDLPDDTKKLMRAKVKSVKLTLPYQDPRKLGASSDCSTTKVNAFYSLNYNKFTVCAGLFNSFQMDSLLYAIILHELSHSIDPMMMSYSAFRKTPLAKLVNEVTLSGGKMNCAEWNEKKTSTFLEPLEIYSQPPQVDQISSCLVDRSQLENLNVDALKSPVLTKTRGRMSKGARSQRYSLVSDKMVIEEGEEVENKYYLKPYFMLLEANDFFDEHIGKFGYFDEETFFTQELLCLNPDSNGKFSDDSFTEAMAETSRLLAIYEKTQFSFVALNDSYLQNFNLARPVGEDWSDWIAHKLLARYLESLNSVEEKRQATVASHALFCEENGLTNSESVKTQIEKNYAQTVHPLDRVRRLRVFSPEIAVQVNCSIDADVTASRGSCDEHLLPPAKIQQQK